MGKIVRRCKVEGCNNEYHCKGYRKRHCLQVREYGKVLKRTFYDKNEIIDCEEYYEICLYNKKCEETTRTKIDKEFLNKIKNYKWSLDGYGYVTSSGGFGKKQIKLHQLIIGKKKGYVIDHRDHDTLNNQKDNLRHITQHQNTMYCCIPKNNTSGYKGLWWNRAREKWSVEIKFKYKKIFLGHFKNKEEAIFVRKNAEKKYFKKFIYEENEIEK